LVTVYIGIGSNVGDRRRHIKTALQHLRQAGLTHLRTSRWYDTAPVGGGRQGRFLNGVVRARTSLSPLALLARLKSIEREMGRRPTRRWGPRVIDLDILLYGRRRVTSRALTVPHPRIQERGFVLLPLSELLALRRLPGLRTLRL